MSGALRLLVASALLLCAAVGGEARREPVDICSAPCVGEVYMNYCGGAACGTRPRTEQEYEMLCSATCLDALRDENFLACVRRTYYQHANAGKTVSSRVDELTNWCSTHGAESPAAVSPSTAPKPPAPTPSVAPVIPVPSPSVAPKRPVASPSVAPTIKVASPSVAAEAPVAAKDAPASLVATDAKKELDVDDLVDHD